MCKFKKISFRRKILRKKGVFQSIDTNNKIIITILISIYKIYIVNNLI